MRTVLLATFLLVPALASAEVHDRPRRAKGGDPVVAERTSGGKYDARTGKAWISNAAAAAKKKDDGDGSDPLDTRVVLYEDEDRYEQSLKKFGDEELNVEFGKVTANKSVVAGATFAEIEYENRISIVEAHGEHDYKLAEGKYGKLGVKVQADAMVGAEGVVGSATSADRDGITLGGGLEGLAGARLTCQISSYAVLCDLDLTYTATPEATAGAGVTAKGFFTLDFATMKFKIGGKAGLTKELGLGFGHELELDLQALVKNHKATLDCLENATNEALDEAKYVVRDVIYEGAKRRIADFVEWIDPPARYEHAAGMGSVGGWNESRRAKTRPGAAIRTSSEPTRSAGTNRGGRALSR